MWSRAKSSPAKTGPAVPLAMPMTLIKVHTVAATIVPSSLWYAHIITRGTIQPEVYFSRQSFLGSYLHCHLEHLIRNVQSKNGDGINYW